MNTEKITVEDFFNQLKETALTQKKKKVKDYNFKFVLPHVNGGLTGINALINCQTFTSDEVLDAYIAETFGENDSYAVFGFNGEIINLIYSINLDEE